ncbi:MAG: hypothetical protein ACREC6_13855 [Hyphomicrobiaceae bacterium]
MKSIPYYLIGLLTGALLASAMVLTPADPADQRGQVRLEKSKPAAVVAQETTGDATHPKEKLDEKTVARDRFRSTLRALVAATGGPAGDADAAKHRDFGAALRALPPGAVDAADVEEIVASVEVPKDYQNFLRTTLPRYFVRPAADANRTCTPYCDDPNILFHSKGHSYRAAIDFPIGRNTQDPYAPPAADLLITGTYTTPDKMPTGLAVDGNRIISSMLQPWDGLIVVRNDGRIFLKDIERFEFDWEPLDLRRSLEHYQKLLRTAAERGWTMVQSHLLIRQEAVIVKNAPGLPKFQRRMILQDRNGAIAIYDSRDRQLTLFEASEEVVRKYAPQLAINLDMGVYDFCRRRGTGGLIEKCGFLDDTVKLTNLIRIDIR